MTANILEETKEAPIVVAEETKEAPAAVAGETIFKVVTDSGIEIPLDGSPFFVAENIDHLMLLLQR